MNILSSVLPILVMIGIGMLCRKIKLLSLLLRPLLPGKYNRYLPFITSVYEGGMMAYPLYTNLFGEENLANIAIFDIATMLFFFSFSTAMLQSVNSGNKMKLSEMVKNAFRSPVFIAVILGIACGISGILKNMLDTDLGTVYMSTKSMITTVLNSLILIVIGYDFDFDKTRVKIAIRAIFARVLTQGLLLVPFAFVIRYLYPGNLLMHAALFVYMSAPPSFSMQTYIREEEPSKLAATTTSLYMLVTLAAYTMIAVTFVK